MAKRSFKPSARQVTHRDAKFILIATEGTATEPTYFESLALAEEYKNPRVKVEVIKSVSTASSPKHILERLNKAKRKYNLTVCDELWLVIDIDNWKARQLSEVAQQVQQKGYALAESNPCFELWLLLHHKSLADYDKNTLAEFKDNQRQGSRTRLEKELVQICGSYNKSKLQVKDYIPHIKTAIKNAEQADRQPADRWLNQIGSRVYKLAQSTLDSSKSLD